MVVSHWQSVLPSVRFGRGEPPAVGQSPVPRQYLRALGRLYWELGRVVLHRCCSSSWSVLVFELRAMSPAVVRAALLGELGATSSVTMSMGLFQMDPKGGAGEVGVGQNCCQSTMSSDIYRQAVESILSAESSLSPM